MTEHIIKGYKPEKLFRFFEDIAAIPHGSCNEKAIADYLEAFAVTRNLEFYRDGFDNILIKCPATAGYENEPAVILQGHTDMVCEKNSDCNHDFENDPLDLYVEDGWLKARGTTLGADDGIAVAVMLALLDGEAEEHPALECLFTVQEEIGLVGAINFDYSRISARRMINLDSAGEGCATVGCAGGCRTDIKLPVELVPAGGNALKITLFGLMGGHSGEEINAGRENAIKLMGRLLLALRRDCDYNLISINGGLMDNAIPRECEAVITVRDIDEVKPLVIKAAAAYANELSAADSDFKMSCEPCELPEYMMNCACTRKTVAMLGSFNNGVLKMSQDIEGLVEYSRNIGIIRTENGCVKFTFSSRTAIESQLDSSCDYLDAFAELCGATCEHHGRYPGWAYSKESPIRDKYVSVAREVLGTEPRVEAIHAGLECGTIKSQIPDMDIVAIGAVVENMHTPDEKLELASFERFWQIIVGMLKK